MNQGPPSIQAGPSGPRGDWHTGSEVDGEGRILVRLFSGSRTTGNNASFSSRYRAAVFPQALSETLHKDGFVQYALTTEGSASVVVIPCNAYRRLPTEDQKRRAIVQDLGVGLPPRHIMTVRRFISETRRPDGSQLSAEAQCHMLRALGIVVDDGYRVPYGQCASADRECIRLPEQSVGRLQPF